MSFFLINIKMITHLVVFLIPLFVSLYRSSLGDVELFVLQNFLYYGLVLFITAVATYLKGTMTKEPLVSAVRKGLITALFTIIFLYLVKGNRYSLMPFTIILGVANYPILVDSLVMLTGYSLVNIILSF